MTKIRNSPSGHLYDITGTPGPPGPAGPQGPQGPPGAGVSMSFSVVGSSIGTLLQNPLTLESSTNYTILCQAMFVDGSRADLDKSRFFNVTVCVVVDAAGNVSQQSAATYDVMPSGTGEIAFDTSVPNQISVYGYGADGQTIEVMAGLAILATQPHSYVPTNWYPTVESSNLFTFDSRTGLVTSGSNIVSWSGQIGSVLATASGTAPTFTPSVPGLNNVPAVTMDASLVQSLILSGLSSVASDYTFLFCFETLGSLSALDQYLFDTITGRLAFAPVRQTNNIAYTDGTFKAVAGASIGPQQLAFILRSPIGGVDQAIIRKNRSNLGVNKAYTQRAIGGTTRMGRSSASNSAYFNGHLCFATAFLGTDSTVAYYAENYIQREFLS